MTERVPVKKVELKSGWLRRDLKRADDRIREWEGRDWTTNRKTGRTNSSQTFERLCGEVEELIRGSANSLIAGDAGSVARLIVAQLAHVHHLAPRAHGEDQKR